MGRMTDEHSPLIRVHALHALEYCERLFYLEEVEDIRVADAAVYAGRTLHVELEPGTESRSFDLASERLAARTRRYRGKGLLPGFALPDSGCCAE